MPLGTAGNKLKIVPMTSRQCDSTDLKFKGTQNQLFPNHTIQRDTNVPPLVLMFHSTTNRPQPHRYIYVGTPDNLRQRTDVSPDRTYSCRVGFSGRGSIGVLRRKGERKSEFIPNVKREYNPSYVEYRHTDACGDDVTTRLSLVEKPPSSYLVKSFNRSQVLEYLAGLALRCKLQRNLDRENVSTRDRRVCKALTRRGKRAIDNGISLLEYRYGVRCLGFYTLTCPYTNSEEIQVFNDNYSTIVKRYLEWVKRQYVSRGLKFNYVGVHEIQPGRYRDTGDECLHLHYIAPAMDSSGRFILLHGEMVDSYKRIIENTCGIPVNGTPRLDAALVKKSASSYLAKYYSKGSHIESNASGGGARASLSTWHTISRGLLLAIRRSTIELPESYSDELFRSCRGGEIPPCVSYLAPVYIEVDGERLCCGCVFRLSKPFLDILREIVFPQVEYLL